MLPSVLVSLVTDYSYLSYLKHNLIWAQQDGFALKYVEEQNHEIC